MIRSSLFVSLAIVTLPFAAQAIASPGTLIKASGPSVYYLGQDQKRYVFPSEATYKTWYADFSSVQTISDQELASYALGGNVTHRPGVRLVKITTDPKVYAVARGGMLRWIETEAIARALYGDHWTQMVDDVPDAFFVNYHVTNSIRIVGDFAPATERDAVTYIGMNRTEPVTTPVPAAPPSPVPPTPAPIRTAASSSTITLFLSPDAPAFGSSINIRAEATPRNANLLKLFFEDALQRTCEYYLCSISLDLPNTSAQSTFAVRAEARFDDGSMTSSTLLVIPTGRSQYVNFQLSQTAIEPAGVREVIATATNGFIAHFLDISIDGNIVRGCIDQQECRYSAPETSPIGAHHTVYVVATDRSGKTTRSETQTFSVVANAPPIVGVLTGKSSIFVGETVDVRVTAADNNGITETRIMVDGNVIKTCTLSICDAIIGPWREPRSVVVVGTAKDALGAQTSVSSTTVNVR